MIRCASCRQPAAFPAGKCSKAADTPATRFQTQTQTVRGYPAPDQRRVWGASEDVPGEGLTQEPSTPIATIALAQQSGVPAWQTIPSWAVVGTADHAIPLALQLAMANTAHAHITEIDASHLSMISDPGAVTNVILKAVRATS